MTLCGSSWISYWFVVGALQLSRMLGVWVCCDFLWILMVACWLVNDLCNLPGVGGGATFVVGGFGAGLVFCPLWVCCCCDFFVVDLF